MLFSMAASALAALTLLQQVDTTVPAREGQRLVVDSYGGEIDVKTWSKNAVRVEADPSPRTDVEINTAGGTVSIRTEGRRGPPSAVDLRITVPAWMGLDLSGVYTDVKVAGTRAPITVETVQGEVDVTGGEGIVSLRSVQGSVRLKGAKGRIDVHSVNEDVRVSDASGEVVAETVNGEIILERVDATSLEATTVNGDVGYDGPIRNGGRYTMSSHNGDVTLAVAESSSASVAVSTYNGEFASAFPVTLRETRKGKRFSFTLGSGSAQVSLESFQGTVQLVRPGHLHQGDNDEDHDHDDDSDR
ncbi:MAG TPA: DUF4097 family beta strand repeat-containing protein [Gemmatimonadales bacterium]|nr:DUF4097 family beta strand repeat-containing protein [Gemmatimonadales bacterium]